MAGKSQIIDGSKVAEGRCSSGTWLPWDPFNGYSLVRRVFADYTGEEDPARIGR